MENSRIATTVQTQTEVRQKIDTQTAITLFALTVIGIGSISAIGMAMGRSYSAALFTIATQTDGDFDDDGIADHQDNCIRKANGPLKPDTGGNVQLDTDGDGYGNFCDPDLDNTGVVTISDFVIFKESFGASKGGVKYNPDADFDGSGTVSIADFITLRKYFNKKPGP